MPVTIRETTILAGDGFDVVQLHISDAAPDDEAATFVVKIHARLPQLPTPTVAHIQRQAMKAADDTLNRILQELAAEIKGAGYQL